MTYVTVNLLRRLGKDEDGASRRRGCVSTRRSRTSTTWSVRGTRWCDPI